MRWRDHIYGGVSVLETDRFAPGIPARVEAREVCLTAGVLVSSPPGVELLVPSSRVCRAADAEMSTPYRGVSVD
jgi:hypothetical protein